MAQRYPFEGGGGSGGTPDDSGSGGTGGSADDGGGDTGGTYNPDDPLAIGSGPDRRSVDPRDESGGTTQQDRTPSGGDTPADSGSGDTGGSADDRGRTGGTYDPDDPLATGSGPDRRTVDPRDERTPTPDPTGPRRDPRAAPETTTPDQPPTGAGGTDAPPSDDDLGPMADRKREFASEFDRFGPGDVAFRRVDRPGGGDVAQPYIPDSAIRDTLRQEVASQSSDYSPSDVVVTEPEEGRFEARIPKSVILEQQRAELRQRAADRWDVDIGRVVTVREGDTLRAGVRGEADDVFPDDNIGGPIEDYEELSGDVPTGTGGQGTVGRTTDPTYDPSAEQQSLRDVATGAITSFGRDPVGSTYSVAVEPGVTSMEDELSRELGFDVGETAETTGETLVDRPVDSLATGVMTIRMGGAAATSDAGGAAAAAPAAATGTGTGTAVGTGVSATGGAALLPVTAGALGVRGVMESDARLPTAGETSRTREPGRRLPARAAPAAGETVEELPVRREQFPDEVSVDRTAIQQTEIEVGAGAGPVTEEVPVGQDPAIGGPEIEVTGETQPGQGTAELPVGGDAGTGEGTREPAGDSVVPGEYPQAGRDFPADPSREYVSHAERDLSVRAAEQVALGGVRGRVQEDDDEVREITEEELIDPQRLRRERRRDFREQFERFQEDIRGDREYVAPPEERFVSLEVGEVRDGEEEFLIEEAMAALSTGAEASAIGQLPDVVPASETGSFTATSQRTDVRTDMATMQEAVLAQPNVYPEPYGFEAGYATGFGYGYGEGYGQGGDGGGSGRVPLRFPDFEATEEIAHLEPPREFSGSWVNPIARLGTPGAFLGSFDGEGSDPWL